MKNYGEMATACHNIITCVDPTSPRAGTEETPGRMMKAWAEMTRGYGEDPVAMLKVFEDGAEGYDGMVLVKDIPMYSLCEHHALPFFGRATVAYIPSGKIIGLSKIPRVVGAYSRRMQTQERITVQVADLLQNSLGALGVGVLIRARHLCMEQRGLCQQGHSTTTCALRGAMREGTVRAEFLDLARSEVAL